MQYEKQMEDEGSSGGWGCGGSQRADEGAIDKNRSCEALSSGVAGGGFEPLHSLPLLSTTVLLALVSTTHLHSVW